MIQRKILWILIVALGLAACAPSAAKPFASPITRPEGQEVVLWHSYDGPLREALLAQIDEFNAANPWRIVIVPEYHGAAKQLAADLQSAMADGTGPDLAIRNPSDVWSLGDAVVPVQRYANDSRFGFT